MSFFLFSKRIPATSLPLFLFAFKMLEDLVVLCHTLQFLTLKGISSNILFSSSVSTRLICADTGNIMVRNGWWEYFTHIMWCKQNSDSWKFQKESDCLSYLRKAMLRFGWYNQNHIFSEVGLVLDYSNSGDTHTYIHV